MSGFWLHRAGWHHSDGAEIKQWVYEALTFQQHQSVANGLERVVPISDQRCLRW
jgi:hypothetical protein